MSDRTNTELVPCSNCGADVLTNLAECMFCGQADPGKLASNRMGRRIVQTKEQLRKRRRAVRHAAPVGGGFDFKLPDSLRQYSYLFSGDYAVTHTIVAVYVVLYLSALLINLGGVTWLSGIMGIAIPSNFALLGLGATGTIPVGSGRVWTFLTAPYLHTSLIDIGIGCALLVQFGRTTERFFGNAPYYLIYTLSGIAGGIAITLLGQPLVATPRMALFGLFAATIAYTRSQYDSVSQQMMRQFALFAFVLLLFDLILSPAYLVGDIAGGLAGFGIATLLLKNPGFRYEPLSDRVARLLAIVTAAFIVVSLFVAFLF